MFLRKSPQVTPQLLAAARRNAQRSTGPRSPAGKEKSKLNGLKHGACVSAENRRQSMQALGEDPAEYEALEEELRSAFRPGDALLEKQIEDLAWLYWRRERLERALSGLKRRALQGIEEWQHRRRQEMAGVTFEASRHELVDWGLPVSDDRGVRLRLRLSYLGAIREEVKQGRYGPRHRAALESVYRGEKGWRSNMICALLFRFCQAEEEARDRAKYKYLQGLQESGEGQEPPGEGEQQDLVNLLGEEMASVEEELAHEEKANEERAAIERDACLAPRDEAWCVLLRQEGSLDRSIDRKVRILLGLRKESASLAGAPAGGRGGAPKESVEEPAASTPQEAEFVEAQANIKMKERTANVAENKGPRLESRPASRGVLEDTGAYLDPAEPALERQGAIQTNRSSVGLPGATV